MKLEVVILTKSSKNGGYCVAGVNLKNGNWIRLVSDDACTHRALSCDAIKYPNGSICKPLDVVEIPIIKSMPLKYQPENFLIDTQKNWKKINTLSLEDILKIHPPEYHNVLLGNRYNRITEEEIKNVGRSLILVKVTDLTIEHPREKSTKATFTYNNTQYSNMSVTDPNYYDISNHWHTDNAILVMSLPESPYLDSCYYKFIAKIFLFNS